MKPSRYLIIFVLLAVALAACQAKAQATHTPFPLAVSPTSLPATATPLAPTVTPVPATTEPPTTTPEIFIPKTQAVPGGASFAVPASCLENAVTYVSRADGYCFAYPLEFTLSKDSGISVASEPLDSSAEPIIVKVGITVMPADGQTLEAAVQVFLQEFVGANPPWQIPSADITVGTDTGRFLDPVPGLGSTRVIIVIHNGSIYRFIFYPSPANADGTLNTGPGVPSYDKFQTLYAAVMGSFNFLDGTSKKVDVPLSVLDSEQPFSFDSGTGSWVPLPAPQPTSTPTSGPTPTATIPPVVAATPDPNQNVGGLRFEDRFDGGSGWLWGFTEEGVVSFSEDNGSVLASLEAKNKGWRISMGPDAFSAGDQQVQLKVRTEACGGQDTWGLFFRGALNSNDKFNGYVFKLNCSGQASVERLAANKSTVLLGSTPVSAANAGAGVENTLLVWAAKDEMRFYVNGQYVGTVHDSTYDAGEYGLYVDGRSTDNARFRFYDLRVNDVTPPAQ